MAFNWKRFALGIVSFGAAETFKHTRSRKTRWL
ncbi:hypothetical protein LCGC14_1583580, partial [marine sediment metagenome]